MTDVNDLETLEDRCFKNFLDLIHALTGITIAANRKSMVQGRLRKRVVTLGLGRYEEYLELVKKDDNEKIIFIDLVTTNETYFFRTPRVWTYIAETYLPEWMFHGSGKTFMAWSAAASSGEEGYSLGVTLQAFKEKNPKFIYQILGTDISREMVGLCSAGLYQGRSIESFSKNKPELFKKYMKDCGESGCQVIPEIKSRIRFQEHNLFKPFASKELFDLVLIRNVLIYFTGPDQEKVLKLIEPRLASSGVLIIGESESLSHISTGYSNVQPLIYKKAALLDSKIA